MNRGEQISAFTDAVAMAFMCGTPNGMKAWHSGHALNQSRNWLTLSAGHDHPDANSFIVINGDDYLAVDEGYAKEKRTRNHRTLLVDGPGQYAEGTKNAFRGLDETWGARFEASLELEGVIYVRGEAARAYERDMELRQFTREALFLEGEAVVLRDVISADVPHRYHWLLQTDAPAEPKGHGCFTIESGAAAYRVHALQPDGITHQVHEQVIKANPTSAKPDWIISNTQYALTQSPPEPCQGC